MNIKQFKLVNKVLCFSLPSIVTFEYIIFQNIVEIWTFFVYLKLLGILKSWNHYRASFLKLSLAFLDYCFLLLPPGVLFNPSNLFPSMQINTKNSYCSTQWMLLQLIRGQWNLYVPFISKALVLIEDSLFSLFIYVNSESGSKPPVKSVQDNISHYLQSLYFPKFYFLNNNSLITNRKFNLDW